MTSSQGLKYKTWCRTALTGGGGVRGPWAFPGFATDQAHPSVPAGIASVVVSFFLSMYYNVINAWAFWYLFHSFQVRGHTAVEAHGGLALVLEFARHHHQLGRGWQKLQKPSRSFSWGRSGAGLFPYRGTPPGCLGSSHHEMQVKASPVSSCSHASWWPQCPAPWHGSA